MQQTYIVDASVALKWYIDEPKGTEDARRLLRWGLQREVYLIAPALLAYELPNSLLKAVKDQRLPESDLALSLRKFHNLAIAFFLYEADSAQWIMNLAREHRLSFYDAAYLALAQAREAVLATGDIDLAEAAEDLGVRVFRIGI